MHPMLTKRAMTLLALLAADLGSTATASSPVDEVYEALRAAELAETSLSVHALHLERDVLSLDLEVGHLELASPIAGRRWLAVFRGNGRMRLEPATVIERDHLRRLTGQPDLEALEDDFSEAIFLSTDGAFDPGVPGLATNSESVSTEPSLPGTSPRSWNRLRYLMHEHLGLNPELKVLEGLQRPASDPTSGVFIAHLVGQRYPNLVYVLDPRGVDSFRFGPEESGLYNASERPGQGWWYLSHRRDELTRDERQVGAVSSSFEPLHFRIDTAIDEREGVEAVTRLKLRATQTSGRVVELRLSPRLRVRSATVLPERTRIPVIQEPADWSDMGVGVVLPTQPAPGDVVELELSYSGSGIVTEAHDGSYFVGARAGWYPNAGLFHRRASYELGFCVPTGLDVVAVGELVGHGSGASAQSCSEWRSSVPLGMAGFNYGRFKKIEKRDGPSGVTIGIYTSDAATVPEQSLVGAVQSARLYTRAFGPLPYANVAITEQSAPRFPQAWPTLLYLPTAAFPGRAQRCGEGSGLLPSSLEQAHEMAHQWWGHTVGWSTYHDEWLTEGLADFAAALLLEKSEGRACFEDYWRASRAALVHESRGQPLYAAGPLWLGRRLENHRNRKSYGALIYLKGSYILHMLRMMMQSPDAGDQRFLEMLRDFTGRFRHRRVSTAEFQSAVEKAMTKEMDLERNGRMDWFFRQWVYGVELPRYQLDVEQLDHGTHGRTRIRGTLRQSGVPSGFKMLVPLYVELVDGRSVRIGRVACEGSKPVDLDLDLALPAEPRALRLNANFDVLTLN